MKLCQLIDQAEDYIENFSDNLSEVDSYEIAEKFLLVVKAVGIYLMNLVKNEMYLFSSLAYGFAEFLNRTGEHTPQKVGQLIEKISNGIKKAGAVWDEAGMEIDSAIGEMDEQFDSTVDIWADKLDRYIANFDFDFCFPCLLINGVVSAGLSFVIAENPGEFWLETIKTFVCNFVI